MKRIFIALLAVFLIMSLTGCGNHAQSLSVYNKNYKKMTIDTETVAENDSWQLEWDSEKHRVLLKNKLNGIIWSTLPSELLAQRYDEDGYEENNHPQVENPLIIEYIDKKKMNTNILYGYVSCLQKGNYSAEKIDGGIRIIYYFDSAEISVPVEYHLLDDGVRVSVDPLQITEGSFPIYKISVSPFFCSVKNDTDDGYLFVPSGSGAIINPSSKSSDIGYTCSYPVYGEDLQLIGGEGNAYTNTQPVRLPVFGAADNGKAVCAIIDSGAETGSIECNVGNAKLGYSSVYASFKIRGITETGTYSDAASKQKISVSYYPLTDEKANYVGMAEKYRDWLELNKKLKVSDDKRFLSLEIYGATHIDAEFLGIPYSKLVKLTTVDQAYNIISEIANETGVSPIVNMIGFGTSGLETGKIAGGYAFSSLLSGNNALKRLNSLCNTDNIKLFMNYDTVNFSKSGSGVNKVTDRADSAVGQPALRTKREFSTKKEVKVKEYFLARNKTVAIGKKAIDSAEKYNLSGASLTIASSVYSDFSDQTHYNCNGFEEDYKKLAEYAADKNVSLLGAYANAYAAGYSDYLISTPLISDQNDVFTYDIPFYQIVFKGTKSITSSSLNLAEDEENALLRAAETGIGLQFSLISDYSINMLTSEQSNLHSMLYENVRDDLAETVNCYKSLFERVSGSKIVRHSINGDIRKTTFDNGAVVYVNYGNSAYDTEIGTVEAESFIFK